MIENMRMATNFIKALPLRQPYSIEFAGVEQIIGVEVSENEKKGTHLKYTYGLVGEKSYMIALPKPPGGFQPKSRRKN